MTEQIPAFIEDCIQIIWDVLERAGEIHDPDEAGRILVEVVTKIVAKGEHRRLMVINRAIDHYRARKQARAA
jgi:hypothetical protein